MRRPEESNPKTIDMIGVLLGASVVTSVVLNGRIAALGFSILWTLIFAAQHFIRAYHQKHSINGLAVPGVFFGLAGIAVVLSTTTFSPGGGHPLWLMTRHPGGAALDLEGVWIGVLETVGLAFAFLAAGGVGARTQTARSLTDAVIGSGAVLGGLVLAMKTQETWGKAGPDHSGLGLGSGVDYAVLGVVSIVSAERLLRSWLDGSGSKRNADTLLMRIRLTYLPGLALMLALLGLAFGALSHFMIAITMIGLLGAWTILSGGGETKVPRRVLIWLTPLFAGLSIAIAIVFTGAFSATQEAVESQAVHWGAFWASPWLGYGLGGQNAVAALFMDRLNFQALVTFPTPSNAYLSWLEQGGVLVAAPLIACIVWVTGLVLFSSMNARRLQGMMRGCFCSSLFLGLISSISAAPSTFAVEGLWAILLGVSIGAGILKP